MKYIKPFIRQTLCLYGFWLLLSSVCGCASPDSNEHNNSQSVYTDSIAGFTIRSGELQLVPSFETCSYYFYPGITSDTSYVVEFRRSGEKQWRRSLGPVSDRPSGVWKGSIFGLEEDASWQLRVLSGHTGNTIAKGDFQTWTSHPPIARTIDISKLADEQQNGIVISEQGKPGGWIKYTAPTGWKLRQSNNGAGGRQAAIHFKNARYVILENITIEGGYRYAIHVEESESVRIVNCDISGWGRVGQQQFDNPSALGQYTDSLNEVINYDAGVSIYKSTQTVVERCYIHDPRNRANAWMFSHPTGPCAVHANYTLGGTVLRWNDMIGSDEHRWNDVVESEDNGSPIGGFYRDSDIYGNFMAFGNDDGIELEGGGMNVRFYRNKIEGTLCGVSTGACILGPQYVLGNLITNLNDEGGLGLDFFKNINGEPQGGKRYMIGNTLYGTNGSAYGKYGKPLPGSWLGFMRNNIFVCKDSVINSDWQPSDDFNNDLFWAGNSTATQKVIDGFRKLGLEKTAIAGDPQFIDPEKGDYRPGPNSLAKGSAASLNNISAEGADLGAFPNGHEELPERPLALIAQPRQLNFSNPAQFVETQVELSLPESEKKSVTFQVKQNSVSDWFRVEPAFGEIEPGKSLKLTVTIDRKRLYGRPVFRGAFLVRTIEGLSRPISVYAKGNYAVDFRPKEASNTVYIDAPAIPAYKKFVVSTDEPTVSGGKYVKIDSLSVNIPLDVEIAIPQTGKYFLLARLGFPQHLNDRDYEFSLDQKTKRSSFQPRYSQTFPGKEFKMFFLHSLGTLSQGKHALRFLSKDQLDLNELVITDNPAVFFIQHANRDAK